jgi:hypothetical protein
MPVTRPEYGRKPKPSVTAPDFGLKKATTKTVAEKAVHDTAVAAALVATAILI